MLEFGGIERVFSLPSEFCRQSSRLVSLFNGNLATKTEVDAAEEEVNAIMTAGVVSHTTRVMTIMEEDAAAKPAVPGGVVVDGAVVVDVKNNVSDVKVATTEGNSNNQGAIGDVSSANENVNSGESRSTDQNSDAKEAGLPNLGDSSKNNSGFQDENLPSHLKQEGCVD